MGALPTRLSVTEIGALPERLTAAEAWVVVGPEGGLGEGEARALSAVGFAPVRLGPTVLRVETAAVVASALVLDRVRRAGARAADDR